MDFYKAERRMPVVSGEMRWRLGRRSSRLVPANPTTDHALLIDGSPVVTFRFDRLP